jgi:hypothetical protein
MQLCFLVTHPLVAATIIGPVRVERVDSALVVTGIASALPPNTKLWVQVEKIDNSLLSRSDPAMEDRDVRILPDHTFVARVLCAEQFSAKGRSNACGVPPFPDGKYQLLISSHFNRSWQSVTVLKAVGVEVDSDGRSGLGNPKLLPVSPDLTHDEYSRFLKAVRTVVVGDPASKTASKFHPAQVEKKVRTGVTIGMTSDEVEDSSWGKPRSVNRTVVAGHIHEQWVYSGSSFLYFDDGILTAIQN